MAFVMSVIGLLIFVMLIKLLLGLFGTVSGASRYRYKGPTLGPRASGRERRSGVKDRRRDTS